MWIVGLLFALFSFNVYADASSINHPPIPHLQTLQDPTLQKIIDVYQTTEGQNWVNGMSQLLDPDAVMLQWSGKQVMPARGSQAIVAHLNQEASQFPGLKKKIGRFMTADGMALSGSDPYPTVLILFYETSFHPLQSQPWVWAGCDIITVQQGKIIDWRIEEDTHMKWVKHPTKIDMANEYRIIDQFWRPQTTTNERVGMSYILDLKRTVMPTEKRGELLLARMKDSMQQSTWEPDGILYLKNKAEIKGMFFDGLIAILPDFYEHVERTLVAGNALIMLQNPSGTQGKNHRAWYNCDIYFFDGPDIAALLFQRDTQMDIVEEQKGAKL